MQSSHPVSPTHSHTYRPTSELNPQEPNTKSPTDSFIEEPVGSDLELAQHGHPSSGESLPRTPRRTPSDPPPHSSGVDVYGTLSEDEQGTAQLPSLHFEPNSKKHKQKIKFKVLDGAKLGDYERSPSYQCSSVVTFATQVDSKYSGNYERDPNYMRRIFDPSVPHRIPHPGEVLEGSTSGILEDEGGSGGKYRGDYERCETYVLPPKGGVASRYMLGAGKYRGDYERNPVYIANLLAAGSGVAASLVPPSHEYTPLAATTRQPPQPYVTTLTQHPSGAVTTCLETSSPNLILSHLTKEETRPIN